MATTISNDDVLHLATLSNLKLSDDEVASLRSEIESILGYVAQLDELDTEGVDPAYQVVDLENIWREDVVEIHDANREKLLSLSPEREGNQIKVPKVL